MYFHKLPIAILSLLVAGVPYAPPQMPDATLPTIVQILNGEKPSNTGPVLFA